MKYLVERDKDMKIAGNVLLSVLCAYILLFNQIAYSNAKLPRLISDGMVLQRDTKVKIWGWAATGESVSVKLQNQKVVTTTKSNGKWMVTLAPLKAGGPYTMVVSASNQITVKDILVGDVWICSGQSNMVLPMERVKERYADVIAHSVNTEIRQFNIETHYNFTGPQDDIPTGSWESADSRTVLHFTAVGYFFAKSLYEKHHVPIGLIKVCVGGSPAEAWLSEDALQMFPVYLEEAIKCKDSVYVNQIRNKDNLRSSEWYTSLRKNDQGYTEGKIPWSDTTYNDSSWETMIVPSYWKDGVLGPVNGVVWFRKEINVPATMIGKPIKLTLGRIVDSDSVYVNGVFVGTTSYQYPPRRYEIPAGILKAGKNLIVVRVISAIGSGGFVKDKMYQLSDGDQFIDLRGEWKYKLGTTATFLEGPTFFHYKPLGLFNGMIAPLLNHKMKGVIWYQGEANADRAIEYRKLFPALIKNWRAKWHEGDFPFLYVQLANFMEFKNQPVESNWAELRESQRKTLALPKTGMVVSIDLGEWNDIHPENKEDVGNRLALVARTIAYRDKKVVSSGPLYKSMKIRNDKIILSFTNTGSGLMIKGGGELKHFAIAGRDKKFVWAKALIDGNSVMVWSTEVKHPVIVRYAWADNPKGANLFNIEGLPASPFRTGE